jgi:quercetin dioxygenase-like cupin family protein
MQRVTIHAMRPVKDASHLYELQRRACHAERPGFRITEFQLSPTQTVPWHYHNNVQDTFYVIEGQVRPFLREPKEEVLFAAGETFGNSNAAIDLTTL